MSMVLRWGVFRYLVTSLLLTVTLWNLSTGYAQAQAIAKATFAGGCFWCMEQPFDNLPGVQSTTSGYTGGTAVSPTYNQVSSGGTGHAEAVEVVYDPEKVGYEKLVEVFWHNVDPLDAGGQFCDRGNQYRSAIFYQDDAQRAIAEKSKQAIGLSLKQPIQTQVVKAEAFYPAEAYHQNFYKTNALKYKFYRFKCGRDQRIAEVWGNTGH